MKSGSLNGIGPVSGQGSQFLTASGERATISLWQAGRKTTSTAATNITGDTAFLLKIPNISIEILELVDGA